MLDLIRLLVDNCLSLLLNVFGYLLEVICVVKILLMLCLHIGDIRSGHLL